jgi:hypothetical protein
MRGAIPIARRTEAAERVLAWIDAGALSRPGQRADLVDLVRALARLCGAVVEGGARADAIAALIGGHEHLVFVLIDGLGVRLLDELDPRHAGFLGEHATATLHAVFPSTTAVALTSLATGVHPAEHGVTGWWTWLPEFGVCAELLPFVERFSRRSLSEFGLDAQRVLHGRSLLPRFDRDRAVVTRGYIVDSTYSRWWSGGCTSLGYERIHDGVERVVERVRAARQPTYTHLYLNQLDTLCHQLGIHHPDVGALFAVLDAEMARLRRGLGADARIVLSADHGHIDAGEAIELHDGDPLLGFLRCPPSGESRVPVFHLTEAALADAGEAFATEFARIAGDEFALLPIREVEALGLLGPAPMSAVARARFGHFLAVGADRSTVQYRHPQVTGHRQVGVHAGLTPAEMEVPLILA